MKVQTIRRQLPVIFAGLAISAASSAWAHARLMSETPMADKTAPAPKVIALHFSEAVVPQFTGLDLSGPAGSRIEVIAVAAKDPKALTVTVPAGLAQGRYLVKWHAAAADDGHRTTGEYHFLVQ